MEDAAPDKGFRAQVVLRHMHGQRQVVSGCRLADRDCGSGVGGGEVPGHDEQGYLVVVAALQRAASGIEFVPQALRGGADPLLGLLAYTLGRLAVVEDVRSRRLRNVGGATHVLNRWLSW